MQRVIGELQASVLCALQPFQPRLEANAYGLQIFNNKAKMRPATRVQQSWVNPVGANVEVSRKPQSVRSDLRVRDLVEDQSFTRGRAVDLLAEKQRLRPWLDNPPSPGYGPRYHMASFMTWPPLCANVFLPGAR